MDVCVRDWGARSCSWWLPGSVMRSGICLGPGAWATWTDREDGCRRVGKLVQVFARCLLHVVFLVTLVLCGGHRGTEHLPHHGFTQLASILFLGFSQEVIHQLQNQAFEFGNNWHSILRIPVVMSQFSSSLVCPALPSPSPPPLLAITCLRQLNGLVLPFDLVQLKDRLDTEQLSIEKWTRPQGAWPSSSSSPLSAQQWAYPSRTQPAWNTPGSRGRADLSCCGY